MIGGMSWGWCMDAELSSGVNVKRMVYERIVVPTVLYGAETLG